MKVPGDKEEKKLYKILNFLYFNLAVKMFEPTCTWARTDSIIIGPSKVACLLGASRWLKTIIKPKKPNRV